MGPLYKPLQTAVAAPAWIRRPPHGCRSGDDLAGVSRRFELGILEALEGRKGLHLQHDEPQPAAGMAWRSRVPAARQEAMRNADMEGGNVAQQQHGRILRKATPEDAGRCKQGMTRLGERASVLLLVPPSRGLLDLATIHGQI